MKLQRIVSLTTLAISIFTLYLVLKKPAPVARPPASPAAAAANAQSFQEKLGQVEQPRAEGADPSEVHISSAELGAALAQTTSMTSTPASARDSGSSNNESTGSPTTTSPPAELPGPVPEIKDYQLSMDGDIVRGQFLTQIAGKDVYVTLSGHLRAKDGYATFEATEAKIGDLSIPVSIVNEALEKKMAEQREQMKLPANVKDIRVENGELVLVPK